MVRQFHLLSGLYARLFVCLCFKNQILILKSGPAISETVFPCFGILYQSLGLDITSVFLNPFKTVATYPFF